MRGINILVAWSLTVALRIQAHDAYLFTTDPVAIPESSRQRSISEDDARVIIRHRIQDSDSSSLGLISSETAELLNVFGGRQRLFTTDGNQKGGNCLLFLHGLIEPEITSRAEILPEPDLRIANVSAKFSADYFLDPLPEWFSGLQVKRKACKLEIDKSMVTSETVKDCLSNAPVLEEKHLPNELLNHVDVIESWEIPAGHFSSLRVSLKADSPYGSDTATVLKSLIQELPTFACQADQSMTMLLLPRAERTARTAAKLKARGGIKEALLSIKLRNGQASGDGVSGAKLVDLPHSLMPICHASNSSCSETTNECSGHGTCYKKYSTKGQGECYACKCRLTQVRRKDGSFETVRWGGAACEKKDISSPFFLIAGISALITGALVSAILMLFRVGQQDLPSVLSSGVGATKPK